MKKLLLLDLDGTLIDTPHYEAWCYAARQIGIENLSYEEYAVWIAGRPRLEGASSLIGLKKSLVRVDSRYSDTCSVLAEIKQLEFLRLSTDIRFFDDALRLLARVETSRQDVKFYTASQNAADLFHTALRRSGKSLSRRAVARQRRGQTRADLFLHLTAQYALDAVTLVDDAPHAVDAACGLGIRAYQIRRHERQPTANDSRARILPSLDDITVPIRETPKDRQ
ncbi:hypothetical protein [Trinickia acidisoli]|uniref:hypothetical protein n=1 Tax=Trinickia acidisoli TaxID=2767482 RepID=UPI001A8E497F|nr:hypothetical protein [Trinickia acidisoli]